MIKYVPLIIRIRHVVAYITSHVIGDLMRSNRVSRGQGLTDRL